MAIARDTGASTFPVTDSFLDTNVATRTSPTFSTNASSTLLIAWHAWRGNANLVWPHTVTWSGGTPAGASTWTNVVNGRITGSGADTIAVSLWIATASAVISTKAVVFGVANADTGNDAAMGIDALTGASSTVTNFGATASNNGSAVNRFFNLTGVLSGSWLYVAYSADDSGGALTVQTNTTKVLDSRPGANGMQSATGYNSSGTSGSINVGFTGTQAFAATAAMEIFAGATPAFEDDSSFTPTVQPDLSVISLW